MTGAQARACAPWYRVVLMALKLQRTVDELPPVVLERDTRPLHRDCERLASELVGAATRLLAAAERAHGVIPGGGVADG